MFQQALVREVRACCFVTKTRAHGVLLVTKKPTKPAKPAALMGKKPSKFALEGNKWLIVS